MTKQMLKKSAARFAESSPTVAGVQSELILADRILRDGEQIILMVKPSVWFILLRSVRQLGALLILGLIAIFGLTDPLQTMILTAVLTLAVAQLIWASCRWLGRIYVLTDQRVLRIDGLLTPSCWAAMLTELTAVEPTCINGEGLLKLGSLGLFAGGRIMDCWIHLDDPATVAEEIQRAITHAHQRRDG